MNPLQRPDSFMMADYTGVLRRRWWIVLGLACIGLIGAFAYTAVAAKAYTATAAVFVSPTGADQSNQVAGSRTAGAVNLDTEAQIVQSTDLAATVVHTLHSSLTPYEMSQQVSVTVPPNSEVLNISCQAPSANAAAVCAQAFAVAYLKDRSASSTASINAQLANLHGRVDTLQTAVSGLNSKISALPANSPQRLTAQTQLSSDTNELHNLTGRVATLTTLNAQSSGGRIITDATPPGKPSSPKKSIVLPSGLIAGLLLGLIAAFVWDRRDKRIHRAQDVERLFDLPVMMSLPKGTFSQQVSLVSPRSRAGQAFTELAHGVTATLGEGNHVLLVAGASPGAAGSVIAANLAATLVRAQSDVVLVCADVDGSVAPEMLGLGEGRGLAEIVEGSASVREVARGPAGLPGLWVITPGASTSLSSYYVQHDAARGLTSQLRRDARYVIIEAQGTEDVADTFAFAEFADAALIGVEVSRTSRDEVSECVRRLERLRTPIIGTAVLPALGRRVRVRAPRPGQLDLGTRQGDAARDGITAARSEDPPVSAVSAGTRNAESRSARSGTGHNGPADRIPGS